VGFELTRPLLLGAGVIALAVVFFTWSRLAPPLAPARARLSLGLRVLIVLLLTGALAGFAFQTSPPEQSVMVLADLSASTQNAVDRETATVHQILAQRQGKDRAGVVSFGRDPQVEVNVGTDPQFAEFESRPNANYTDLASALQLADANIVRAIQLVSTERGRDPRDYALVPFGGAGPLHAARIAEELGISTIVVPPNAGVISAYGLVASDYTKFDAVTRKMKLDETAAKEAGKTFAEMRQRLAAQFADMKLPGDLVYTHTLDMRFVGQAFEVGVEIPADRLSSLDAAYLAELFADAHHRTFMHGATLDRPVEIVTLRVGATLPIGTAPKLEAGGLDREKLAARAAEKARVFHGDGWLDCARFINVNDRIELFRKACMKVMA